jgi:hypothetical protein
MNNLLGNSDNLIFAIALKDNEVLIAGIHIRKSIQNGLLISDCESVNLNQNIACLESGFF